MKRELVVRVMEKEKDEIEYFFERINSLKSLSVTLAANNELYQDKSHLVDRIVSDLSVAQKSFRQWWETIAEKYGLEIARLENYKMDFKDCAIYYIQE